MNFNGTVWLVRSFTDPLTSAVRGLPSLSTETLITPWFLLRVSPAALAISGVRKVELNVL
ncbi:hypothetical protein D3C87_2130580 [compost metagenome]